MKIFETEEGKQLKALLASKLLELQNIENVKEISDPKEQAIELKAQKRAFEKLAEILSAITGDQEFKKSPKDSYIVL